MQAAIQTATNVARYWRIWIILASGACVLPTFADDAPPDLVRHIVERETATAAEQANYTYRQEVTVEEINNHGMKAGSYHEARDIIFSPAAERTEKISSKPSNTLVNLKLTEEDFRDIREIQPFLLTKDQ